jgi:hypothetical protein
MSNRYRSGVDLIRHMAYVPKSDGSIAAYILDGFINESGKWVVLEEWYRNTNGILTYRYNSIRRMYNSSAVVVEVGYFDGTDYTVYHNTAIVHIKFVSGKVHALQNRKATVNNIGLILREDTGKYDTYKEMAKKREEDGTIFYKVQCPDGYTRWLIASEFWMSMGIVIMMPKYMRPGDITHINYTRKKMSPVGGEIVICSPDKSRRKPATV